MLSLTLSFSLVGLLLLTTLVGVADVNVCECVVNVADALAWHSTVGKAPTTVTVLVRTDSVINVGVVNVGKECSQCSRKLPQLERRLLLERQIRETGQRSH